MRRRHTWLLGLLFVILLLAAGAVGALYLRDRSLPVYAMGELPPSQGYANNTLTLEDVTYVSGKAEFRLWVPDEPLGPRWPIGRTAGDMRIYRPHGEANGDYIFVTGDMMPQMVYRNSRLAPLELSALRVREIRLPGANRMASPRTSQDAELIGEVMASLTAGESVTLHPDYDAGDQGYRLDLLAEQLPGLAYNVDTLVNRAGRVYLSTQSELGQDQWIPAGERFTRWASVSRRG